MIVRRIERGDMPDVVAMSAAFHQESPVFAPLPFDPAKVYELVVNAIDNERWLPLIAYSSGGEVVGIALFYAVETFFGPAIEIGDLAFYVPPGRRGSLAAAGMMEEFLRWAMTQQPAMISIGINTGINEELAARFFERCGFTHKGRMLFRHVQSNL